MKLKVQAYLKAGKTLEDLKSELGIEYSIYDNLVILNYHQCDSPKLDPIVMECRGVVLEKDTWNLVSIGFKRFFNYGEAKELQKDFNWNLAYAVAKIDGSYINVFYYNNRWYMTTRKSIEGQGNVNFCDITFRQLFFNIIDENYPLFFEKINFNHIYIFKLTSPENKVVKRYTESSLHLLAIRDRENDFKELHYEEVKRKANFIGVKYPIQYQFKNINHLLQLASELKDLDEGFVVVDYSADPEFFPRIKIKNPKYVAIAHLKESGSKSIRALITLIWRNEYSEFLTYFPEFTPLITSIVNKYETFVKYLNNDIELHKELLHLDRKEYAQHAKNSICSSIMFLLYDKKFTTLSEYLNNAYKVKGEKYTSELVMNMAKIQNVCFIECNSEE